jgi:hypothetical protein
MSSQAGTRRRVQPPARFPKDKFPLILPVSVPDIRAPTDSATMEAPAVTYILLSVPLLLNYHYIGHSCLYNRLRLPYSPCSGKAG